LFLTIAARWHPEGPQLPVPAARRSLRGGRRPSLPTRKRGRQSQRLELALFSQRRNLSLPLLIPFRQGLSVHSPLRKLALFCTPLHHGGTEAAADRGWKTEDRLSFPRKRGSGLAGWALALAAPTETSPRRTTRTKRILSPSRKERKAARTEDRRRRQPVGCTVHTIFPSSILAIFASLREPSSFPPHHHARNRIVAYISYCNHYCPSTEFRALRRLLLAQTGEPKPLHHTHLQRAIAGGSPPAGR
jgi:hypothetical protein